MLNVKKIKDIREDHDITQQKMADILGVKRSTYSLWEIGISTIPLKNLCDFVDYFQKDENRKRLISNGCSKITWC